MPLRFKVNSVKRIRPGSDKVVGEGVILEGNRNARRGDRITWSARDGAFPLIKPGETLTGTMKSLDTHISESHRPQGIKFRSQSRRA